MHEKLFIALFSASRSPIIYMQFAGVLTVIKIVQGDLTV